MVEPATPFLTLAVRAIGPVTGLVDLPVEVEGELGRWGITGPPPAVRLFRPIAELAGHTLVLAQASGQWGTVKAAGCARQASVAVRACIGELVERTTLRNWKPVEPRSASAREMRRQGLRVFPVPEYIGRVRFPRLWTFAPYDD